MIQNLYPYRCHFQARVTWPTDIGHASITYLPVLLLELNKEQSLRDYVFKEKRYIIWLIT